MSNLFFFSFSSSTTLGSVLSPGYHKQMQDLTVARLVEIHAQFLRVVAFLEELFLSEITATSTTKEKTK